VKNPPKKIALMNPYSWIDTIVTTALPSPAKHLCHYLLKFMNRECDVAWPSYARISAETGYSKQTLMRHFDTLESEGWIARDRGAKGKNTRYYIMFPVKMDLSLGSSREELVPPTGSSREELSSSREELEVVPERNTNNPLNNPLITHIVDFDEFWKIYPRKEGKKKAMELWKKLKVSPELFEQIKRHISIAFNGRDKNYIPHGDAYVRNERWLDEVSCTKVETREAIL
jgi:hypothetical protein